MTTFASSLSARSAHDNLPLPATTSIASPEFKFVRGEALENPADALRILAAAVEDDLPRDDASLESEPIVEPGRWNRWIPVRDGLLTAEEATILLQL